MDRTLLLVALLPCLVLRHGVQLALDARNLRRPTARTKEAEGHLLPIVGLWAFIHAWGLLSVAYGGGTASLTDAVAALLIISGTAIGLIAIRQLGSSYHIEIRIVEGRFSLKRNGLYAIVRHPLRLGLLMETAGSAILAAHWVMIILWGCLVLLMVRRSSKEDRFLRDHLGDEAVDYQQAVPGFNIIAGMLRQLASASRARSARHTS